jgi:hypothetical protein
MWRTILSVVVGYAVAGAGIGLTFLGLWGGVPVAHSPGGAPIWIPDASGTLLLLVCMALSISLAGYLTAWTARRAELRHGAALGVVLVVVAMIHLDYHAEDPLWYRLALVAVSLPAAAIGGYLRGRAAGWRSARHFA